MNKKIKKFNVMITLALASVMFLSSCSSPTVKPTDTKTPTPTSTNGATNTPSVQPTTMPTNFKQSPILDLVSEKLPKVEDRLPKTPKLVNEYAKDDFVSEVGKYGGTVRMATDVIDWHADLFMMLNEPLLNTPSLYAKEYTGNVLEDFVVNDDGSEYIFTIREGMKWSDGELVTMEDVRFTIEDVIFNTELTPVIPAWMKSGGAIDGTPMKFEIIDDWNFKILFDKPYGGLPIVLAAQNWKGYTEFLKPSHYLKQFYKGAAEFDQAKFDEVAKKNNFPEDKEQFVKVFGFADITNWEMTRKEAVGFPNLQPWCLTKTSDSVYTYERNPYYFKVDADGQQLPYFDQIDSILVQDIEMMTMKTIAGELDYVNAPAALVNMAMYKENEKNGYKTYFANMHITPTDTMLNMTYDDPTWKLVTQDIRFRQALNFALNKEEIIETIYFGYGEPSDLLDKEFNVDKANALLDEMGMDKKGKDGFRLAPDGKPFEILFELGAEAPDILPVGELISEMWNDIGIKTSVKRIEGSLVGNKVAANKLQGRIIWTATPMWYYQDWGYSGWGRAWEIWKNQTKETTVTKEDGTTEIIALKGEEPPQAVKEFYDLVTSLTIVTANEVPSVLEKVQKNMKDNIWYFPYAQNVKQPFICNAKMANISENGFAINVSIAAEQLYYK